VELSPFQFIGNLAVDLSSGVG